ncbi:MAG: hypothetical protein ACYS1A_06290 [Planctomycetota bacterium]|jgi:thioredoxin-like negative regulator of GroEL
MIEKINGSQIQDLLAQLSSKQPGSAETPNNTADVSLQVTYASLIKKAMENPESADDAVKLAKALVASGELESAENIEAAVDNLLRFGV